MKDDLEDKPVVPRAKLEDESASISNRRALISPEIQVLNRRREELRRNHPEVAESERLRKEIETLERETHHTQRQEEAVQPPHKVKIRDGVKFFARPKIRAYFNGEKLFKSRGDNEYAATSSISLFTDLLFVGVLAETGSLAVVSSDSINLARFIVLFLPSWRIWCYIRDIVSMYEMNAASQRFIILWILWLLVGFTVK
jgi:hypothetical protein